MVFRLVLVFCLPQFHASDPLNEHLVDLATELWNIIIALWTLICHGSQLHYQCKRQFSVSYHVARIA